VPHRSWATLVNESAHFFERRHVIDYTMWLAIDGGMLKNIRFKGDEKGDLMLSRQKAYEGARIR
jgi:hypothetical protein